MFLPSNITLQFGDSGDFVSELQRRLAVVRCFNESMVNGFYDGPTVNGVTLFQSQCGLRADGIAGPETLRRLNSSISGDTSSSSGDSNKEEEEKLYAQRQQLLQAEILLQQNQQLEAQAALNAAPPAVEPATAAYAPAPVAVQPPTSYGAPEMVVPAPSAAQPSVEQQMRVAEAVASQQQYQQIPPQQMTPPPLQQPQQGSDALAMLINSSQQPQPQPVMQAQTMPMPPQPVMQAQTASQPPTQQIPAADATPQQAPNLLQRTISAASGMIQKLANYFEAKLPPDALQEVKEIGQMMARSGVKENPIPADPAARAPEQAPSRGPAQQQTQQR